MTYFDMGPISLRRVGPKGEVKWANGLRSSAFQWLNVSAAGCSSALRLLRLWLCGAVRLEWGISIWHYFGKYHQPRPCEKLPQISDLQISDLLQMVLFTYSAPKWNMFGSNCRDREPSPLQSPEATQSLEAQKGCQLQVDHVGSVTSGGPKVMGPWVSPEI